MNKCLIKLCEEGVWTVFHNGDKISFITNRRGYVCCACYFGLSMCDDGEWFESLIGMMFGHVDVEMEGGV